MDFLSRDELRSLMEKKWTPCVSIFMPTYRTVPETKQNPIRLKNLIKEAEDRLTASGLRKPEARKLLKPAKALLNDGLFWQHQNEGFAAFISPEFFRYFRLPVAFKELLVVTDRFHIKPLLHLFSNDGQFYILALSQNEVRLFQCTRHSCNEADLKGIPKNLAEALKYDDPEKQLQFHTRTPRGTEGSVQPFFMVREWALMMLRTTSFDSFIKSIRGCMIFSGRNSRPSCWQGLNISSQFTEKRILLSI